VLSYVAQILQIEGVFGRRRVSVLSIFHMF
jgi:hypothetical protein